MHKPLHQIVVSRRQFLITSGALSGSLVFITQEARANQLLVESLIRGLEPTFNAPVRCGVIRANFERRHVPPTIQQLLAPGTFQLRRATDLLNLQVEILKTVVRQSDGQVVYEGPARVIVKDGRLCVKTESSPTTGYITTYYLIVHFPAQHVAETSVAAAAIECGAPAGTPFSGDGSSAFPPQSYLSRPSRLAFVLPTDESIHIDFETLLSWQQLLPSIVKVAIPGNDLNDEDGNLIVIPTVAADEPTKTETSIVIPDGLVISPHRFMTWQHNVTTPYRFAVSPIDPAAAPIEIWETRAIPTEKFAAANRAANPEELKTVRVVHHYATTCTSDPIPLAGQRKDIVALTTGFDNRYPSPSSAVSTYKALPMECADLRLAPHGGSIRAKGAWDSEHIYLGASGMTRPEVVEYEQQTTQGRDQLVRVETQYFGFPFAVPTIQIQTRRREFVQVKDPNGATGTATMIVERWTSRHKELPLFPWMDDTSAIIGRRMPFDQVTFKWPDGVELNPPIDVTTDPPTQSNAPAACWMIPKCGTEPLEIEVHLRDRQGMTTTLKVPLLLVSRTLRPRPTQQMKPF